MQFLVHYSMHLSSRHGPNMLEHLKHVLVEYKTLIIKMPQDNIVIAQARLNLDLLCGVETLLTLFYMLPLLEVVATY